LARQEKEIAEAGLFASVCMSVPPSVSTQYFLPGNTSKIYPYFSALVKIGQH
jgi:outer membrane protein W